MCVKKFANIDKETQLDVFDRVPLHYTITPKHFPIEPAVHIKTGDWQNRERDTA